jgi:hypothetical protein
MNRTIMGKIKCVKNKLILLFIFIASSMFAQKTELKACLTSGLFSFSGESNISTSKINFNSTPNFGERSYTNNPYGSNKGIGFGVSADITRVTQSGFVFGADLGYEFMRSLITIDGINGFDGTASFQLKATGQTFLNYQFINLFLHFGKRFILNETAIDIEGGFDLNQCLKGFETGNATDINGKAYTTSFDRKTITADPRLRIQMNVKYSKLGFSLGYSKGFVNYNAGSVGGDSRFTSNLIRFGFSYQII